MSSMIRRSDTEWWEGIGLDRVMPETIILSQGGRLRTPMDTAEDFHKDLAREAAEIDAQTGRILPRQVLPDEDAVQPPSPPPSRLEAFVWGVFGALGTMLIAVVSLSVFLGWEGIV